MRCSGNTFRQFVITVLSLTGLVLIVVPGARSSSYLTDTPELQKGVFLVANDSISDSRFQQTVILIIGIYPHGTAGLIINRIDHVPTAHAFPDVAKALDNNKILYYGGPLKRRHPYVLVKTQCSPFSGERVMEDVYLWSRRRSVAHLARDRCGDEQYRVYAGYTGWVPGQLENELAAGDWLIMPADIQTVFSSEIEGIWQRLYQALQGIWVHNDGWPAATIRSAKPGRFQLS